MARPFADVLRELGGGAVYENLTAQLGEIVEAVVETRKVGKLTIELTVKPNGDNSVMIADKIKTVVPEAPRGESIFYVTASGSLVREDPRQEKLPLRRVDEAVLPVMGSVS